MLCRRKWPVQRAAFRNISCIYLVLLVGAGTLSLLLRACMRRCFLCRIGKVNALFFILPCLARQPAATAATISVVLWHNGEDY